MSLFATDATRGALFSDDKLHRLRLWRSWDPSLPLLVWILLNPSVADEDKNDLTLSKCVGFARRNNYGGVVLVNLFTLIATNPDLLARQVLTANVDDADEHIRWACGAPSIAVASHGVHVVVGWGSKPWAQDRARQVLLLIKGLVGYDSGLHISPRTGQPTQFLGRRVLCLGTCNDGSPRHPSRLGYDTPLVEL